MVKKRTTIKTKEKCKYCGFDSHFKSRFKNGKCPITERNTIEEIMSCCNCMQDHKILRIKYIPN